MWDSTHYTHLKCVGEVWDDVSDNVGVGADVQWFRHPEVVGAVSFEELDEDAVSAVLSLEQVGPGDPDTGEADLDSNRVIVRYLSISQYADWMT